MADKDKTLIKALNDAKKRKMYFAFIPKGTNDGKLIVSKKKIPKTEIEHAKTELKVKIAVMGKCSPSPDNGGLTFEVVKDPGPSVGTALKNVIKRDANLIKSEFAVVEDAETELPPLPDDEGAETEPQESASAPPETASAPKALDPAIAEAKEKVTKRLEAIIGPFKEAIGNKSPDSGQMQTLMTTFKEALTKQKYDDAAKALDQLEPLLTKFKDQQTKDKEKAVAKKTDVDKKLTALEKLPNANVFADSITENKEKLKAAQKMIDPPENKYNDALLILAGVETALGKLQASISDYAAVLKHKADTDKKIDRLEKNKQKALVSADIATAKADEKKAIDLAGPPKGDTDGAIKALGVVDKNLAKAEVKIVDEIMKGKSRDDMADAMQDLFKERFGVKLKMKANGDTKAQELEAMKKIYELMAQVPESHATNNPSLKKLERIGGAEGGSYYQAKGTVLGFIPVSEKKVVLQCTRPRSDGTRLQRGLKPAASGGGFDPPVDPDCEPKDGVSKTQSYFDWTTLHEIAHAIDDKQGFMKKNGATADYGGWVEYGSDVSAIAKKAASHFDFNTKDAVSYIEDWLKDGKKPKKNPDAPKDRGDWDVVRQEVDAWCDSILVSKDPWDNMPDDIGGTIYHEAYGKSWVSYLKSARSKAISGYQFRAPGEWFAELYAAYHSGVLKDSHPFVKKFLRDL